MRGVQKYSTFKEMLDDKGVERLLPEHEGDLESAVEVFWARKTTRGTYMELEPHHGAIAMDVEALSCPPSPCF